ncbi:acetolactate synthase large subunit [Streptomyces halstedii]|uniref:acetolactate synthase large subunit n=1 Tax=Streptomyces halstedii TaxID=1944 RepID=UPI003828FAA6
MTEYATADRAERAETAAPPTALEPGTGDAAPRLTGAQALIRSLEEAGADTVFGIPGGAVLPAYDPLMDSVKLRHILVRHEQGAGHAATGYAQATGKVGVCMATSGPGATNLVTAIADAYMDSVPIVAVTGQVPSSSIGTDSFQEADICGITVPITKHNYLVTDPADIPRVIAEAFHVASTGRPGPVLVDITKDALQRPAAYCPPQRTELPGYQRVGRPHDRQIRQAAALLLAAERPVLYVGGGVVKAGAADELRSLVELTGVPVVTTLMALGTIPADHPRCLGMPGMHGTVAAVTALQKADLIFAVGARFDDRVTGRLDSFAPYAKVVHADVDPAEIGKNRAADVPIVGDAREVLEALLHVVRSEHEAGNHGDRTAWWERLDDWRTRYPLGYEPAPEGRLSPQRVIERIGRLAPEGTVFAAGVGQHQMWASQFLRFQEPRHWLNSGGAGTMGYAVPAAMGAKAGMPDRTVWAIDGDGCFQMTNQELTTCALNNIPIKVAVINNGALGMVRQWQTLFYDQRYSHTALHRPPAESGAAAPVHGTRVPDFVKLAEAMGCVGLRCEDPSDLDAVIQKANAVDDRPVVVDFIVHQDAMVWPMVAAGTSNDEIRSARGVRPDFGDVTD